MPRTSTPGALPLTDALLARLTLHEKLALMTCGQAGVARLGLPAYDHWTEALHGVAAAGALSTVYPMPIMLAASFDVNLVGRVAREIAQEGRTLHDAALRRSGGSGMCEGLTFFAPNLNIVRDPRWGRGQETYGEDPWLTATLGAAFIRGVQHEHRACATAKHFAVHSGPEGGRFSFDARASARDLHDTYLPAFRAAVVDAQVGGLMTVYNAVNGTPGSLHRELIEDIARGGWGHQGFVVSDCNAVRFLREHHQAVASDAEAVAQAVKSGVDMELYAAATPAQAAYEAAVQQGLLTEADLDRALRRTLGARERLGRLGAAVNEPAPTDWQAHDATALQAAQAGAVLLKNDGVLPLTRPLRRVAVVGPLADDIEVLLGTYNGRPTAAVSLLDGLRRRFPRCEFVHARGANFPVTPQDIPACVLQTDEGVPGLRADVHAGFGPGGEPVATRTDDVIAWFGRTGQGFTRWSGWLVPELSGRYLLGCTGTGLSRVWLDDALIADDAGMHQPLDRLADVTLEAGRRYRLRYEVMGVPVGWSRLIWTHVVPDALDEARRMAEGADLVIAAVGLNARLEGEDLDIDVPGFQRGDRTSLDLPAEQLQLLQALHRPGRPLVVVQMSGSALAVPWAVEHADAVLQAGYGGQAGGTALAALLAGDVSPAGRLPYTVYCSVEQLPPFDDYAMAGRTYRYFGGDVLYPFGHGLSYTRFDYVAATLSAASVDAGDGVSVELLLRNVGERDADEVVQLYLAFPPLAGVSQPPRHCMRAFARVPLAAGAETRVRLQLDARDLSHVDDEGRRWIGAGPHVLHIGGGQPGTGAPGLAVTLDIQGHRRLDD